MGLWSTIKNIGSKVIGAIPAAVGGIPGAVIGGAVDLAGKYIGDKLISDPNAQEAFDNSMYGSAVAFERSQQAYKTRYQNTMQDMAAAGLNPILAAGSGGFQVGSAVNMSAPQSFMSNPPDINPSSAYQSMTQGVVNEKKVDEVRANTRKLIEETAKTRQDQLESIERTAKLMVEQKKVGWEINKTVQEIKNLEKDWWLKVATFQRTIQEAYNTAARTDLTLQEIENLKREYQILDKQSKLLTFQLREAEKVSDAFSGPIGGVLGYVKAIMSALNINLGAFLPLKTK